MNRLLTLTEERTQRNANGRFAKGNTISKHGGKARARALSSRRRRQIAKQGWAALVTKRFGGDERAAKAWWGAMGAYHYDQQVLDIYGAIRPAFPHPGDPSDFRSRLYQTSLFDCQVREVAFYAVSWNSDREANI
ncbi:MAG: hypothetical protein R2932_59110 [Caldilineaceae bacterium]